MTGSYVKGRLCAGILAAALAAAPAAFGASVAPATAPGAPSCAGLDQSWTGLAVDGNPFGDYSDGTLSVRLSQPGAPETFDWTSNAGVAAVIVGDGNQANVYRYDPGSTADTQMATPSGARPSQIQFCYAKGEGAVLGARYSSGTARLVAPTGCASKAFSARVYGAAVQQVVFTLDGNRVASLHKPSQAGTFSIRVNPTRYRVGVHKLVASVEFKPWTRAHSKVLRASFQRCSPRLAAPRFQGF
jgi:hypothetical protein